MKNTKTKIVLSAIIFLSVVGFTGMVFATGPSLYVSPASLTKTAGDTFSVSVGFRASGSKVCAVEGTLVFNNLSCQSITVAGDVTPQSSPTCSNPHFLIGVPSCTTADKALFTVSAKAGNVGTASISFTGVDIIGEGVSIGSASISGNYTINAVPKPIPAPATLVSEPKEEEPAVQIEQEMPLVQEQPTAPQPIPPLSLLASIVVATTLGTDSAIVSVLVIVIILVLVGYAIYAVIQKVRRKNSRKRQ